MSYWIAGTVMVVSDVSTTINAGKHQQDLADVQMEQGRMNMVASQSATRMAEEDANRKTSNRLTQIGRELLKAQSMATAVQAETGVAGLSAERAQRNVDMQNTFDVNNIQEAGEVMTSNIRMQGFQNNAQIQGAINTAEASRPSNTEIFTNSLLSGIGTGLNVAMLKK